MRIRPATALDADRIAELWEAAWRDGHVGHIPDELLVYRQSDSFERRTAAMIERTRVAEVDGAIVGFVTLKGDEVDQLMVDSSARGTGVAPALLADGARRILEAGHPQPWLAVVTGNARARHFYEREGWQRCRTPRLRGADRGWHGHGLVPPLRAQPSGLRVRRRRISRWIKAHDSVTSRYSPAARGTKIATTAVANCRMPMRPAGPGGTRIPPTRAAERRGAAAA